MDIYLGGCGHFFIDHHYVIFFVCLIFAVGLDRNIILTATFSQSMVYIYLLFITVTFSHYIQRGKTLVVPGPDVLTSCGDPGRLLRLREEYVVGIGGFCSPISDWSTVSSYSSSELNLLTELASGCKGDCMSNQVPGTYSLALFLVHLSFFLSSYSG